MPRLHRLSPAVKWHNETWEFCGGLALSVSCHTASVTVNEIIFH